MRKIAVDVIVFLSHYVIVLLLLVAVVFSLMTDSVFFLLLPSHFGILPPSHASNPLYLANIAGARHVSMSLNFTLISSCPTFCFDDIPFISLNILLALLSVSFTCSFGSTYLLFV